MVRYVREPDMNTQIIVRLVPILERVFLDDAAANRLTSQIGVNHFDDIDCLKIIIVGVQIALYRRASIHRKIVILG
jgi:hypothetical protein